MSANSKQSRGLSPAGYSTARLRWRIAGLGEIVGAGLGGDFVEALADAVPEGWHGSLGGLSQVRFELSEGRLDRVQIGRVGRQQTQLGAGVGDQFAHALDLVGGQVVHHHDIAWDEARNEYFLDVDQE